MATLNGGISSTAELIRITGTPPAPGTYFTIGSEAFKANGTTRGSQGRNFTRDYLAVDRGVAGTTKATHSNGATLTPYYPDAPGGTGGSISATDGTTTVDPATQIVFPAGSVTDVGGGVASVSVLMALIGPFPVAFDSPSIADDGYKLCDLDAGTVVVSVGIFVTTNWDDVAADQLYVELGGVNYGPPDDEYGQIALINPYDGPTVGNGFRISGGNLFIDSNATPRLVWTSGMGILTTAGALVAYAPHGAPTAGAADVYAIIATPA